MKAPVVVFVYNRVDHTERILNALSECKGIEETDVYVFSDGWKNEESKKAVLNVRDFLKKYTVIPNFKVIEREMNYGCTNNIRSGITEIINKYGRVVVVEDDIFVNKNFLFYMNSSLDFYNDKKDIFSIGAYNPVKMRGMEADTFLHQRFSCWGWATWLDRWKQVDWDKKIENLKKIPYKKLRKYAPDMINCYEVDKRKLDCFEPTWDVTVFYTVFEKKMKCVVPTVSHSDNIGFDGSGERCGNNEEYSNKNFNQDYSNDAYHFAMKELETEKLQEYLSGTLNNKLSFRIKQFITRTVLVLFGSLHFNAGLDLYFKLTKKINGR